MGFEPTNLRVLDRTTHKNDLARNESSVAQRLKHPSQPEWAPQVATSLQCSVDEVIASKESHFLNKECFV